MTDLNALSLEALFDELMDREALAALIEAAKREDVGPGALTSVLCIEPDRSARAVIRSRQPGRLAGMALLAMIAAHYDDRLEVEVLRPDGRTVEPGETVARLAGPMRSILIAERVLLNFVCHLSGIATLTARYVQAVAKTGARIFDTRKTIPGLRRLAKYAVRCGGGNCHRLGLFDAVLIKDNHLAGIEPGRLAEKLAAIIDAARRHDRPPDFIEVEVDHLAQLDPVLRCDADVILLDNFTLDQLVQAVAMRDRINRRVQLEASGQVNLKTVAAIGRSGVDRIAVGALTHSAPALDLGVDIHE